MAPRGAFESVKERERCAALVRAYREDLEGVYQKWIKNPPRTMLVDKHKLAINICDAVTKSLKEIEHKIENPDHARSGSEFSLDELEAAERMIAEQEHNPFEG